MRLLEPLEIRQVLLATRGSLVSDELGLAEIEDLLRAELSLGSALPGLGECHTVDGSDQIDPIWSHPELNDDPRSGEISLGKTHITEAEIVKRLDQASGVLWAGLDKDVDVFRETGLGVKRESVTAYDNGPNFPRV